MQSCPLCNKGYNDIAKVCPLDHCTNCGSLELQKMRSRSLSKYDKGNITSIIALIGFMAFFGVAYGYSKLGPIILAIGASAVGVPATVFYLVKSHQNMECKSCRARKFQPITDVKLQKGKRTVEENKPVVESYDKNKSNTIDEIIKIQEKNNRRNFIIGLLSTIGIFIGIIVTIWISRPEFFPKP